MPYCDLKSFQFHRGLFILRFKDTDLLIHKATETRAIIRISNTSNLAERLNCQKVKHFRVTAVNKKAQLSLNDATKRCCGTGGRLPRAHYKINKF